MNISNAFYIPFAAGFLSVLTTGVGFTVPKKLLHLKLIEIAFASFSGACGIGIAFLILEDRKMNNETKRKLQITTGALATFVPLFFKQVSFKNALVSSVLLSVVFYILSRPTNENNPTSEKDEK